MAVIKEPQCKAQRASCGSQAAVGPPDQHSTNDFTTSPESDQTSMGMSPEVKKILELHSRQLSQLAEKLGASEKDAAEWDRKFKELEKRFNERNNEIAKLKEKIDEQDEWIKGRDRKIEELEDENACQAKVIKALQEQLKSKKETDEKIAEYAEKDKKRNAQMQQLAEENEKLLKTLKRLKGNMKESELLTASPQNKGDIRLNDGNLGNAGSAGGGSRFIRAFKLLGIWIGEVLYAGYRFLVQIFVSEKKSE